MRFLVLATLSGLALMGCASVQQAPNTQETIRYASSPCFGACPIYSVEVTPTGLIRFEGKQYTKAIGVKEIQGSVKDYQKLADELKLIVRKQEPNLKLQVVSKLRPICLAITSPGFNPMVQKQN